MKELLKNSINDVTYNIFVGGVLTDPNSSPAVPMVSIKSGGTEIVNDAATKVAVGKYKYTVPSSLVVSEGVLEVTWSFSIDSNSFAVKEYYEVVTPYCTWDDFYEAGRYEYTDWLESERVSRFIIDSYCGQRFGSITTTLNVEGNANDNLKLPWRLIQLDDLSWSDNRNVPVSGRLLDSSGYDRELAADGWVLRLQPNNVYIDPVYNPSPVFRRNVIYNVTGRWGYDSVPGPVEEAAKILTANFLCQDHKYRDRYIKSMKMGERSITFSDLAFEGTGDATADSLLADYRNYPGVAVI